MVMKVKTREELIDEVIDAQRAKDYAVARCVGILVLLVHKMPLDQWFAKAVATGEIPERYLDYFFGTGEGSGVPMLGGYTIDTALKAFRETNNLVSNLMDEIYELDGVHVGDGNGE